MPFTRTARPVPGKNSCRSWLALTVLSLSCVVSHAQTTTPAVSTVVAFNFSTPRGNLLLGADGALYGVTESSTSAAGGLIYRTPVDGSDVTTLYQIDRDEAVAPQAGLLRASDGQLYGTTKFGSEDELFGSGTIFRIAPTGTGFAVFHRFAAYTSTNQDLAPINTNGAFPEGELVEGADGSLYGVTRAGGAAGTGVIYKIARDGTGFQVLHQFATITSTTASGLTVNTDGAIPFAPLVEGADGMFYGTASVGGANGRGTVFRIAFDGSGFQVLHEFSATTADATSGLLENADGAMPLAGLTDGGDGSFYGVTSTGGTTGHGVIFAIPADGATFTVLHHFNGTNGARPIGELLLGADGRLYGTTSSGGQSASGTATSFGTMFSIARSGVEFTSLHSLDNTSGTTPASQLIALPNDVFVGVAGDGGRCGYGTIFHYSGTGATVTGDTSCGNSRNNNNGGGSSGPALLVLLGGLAWLRRRRRG